MPADSPASPGTSLDASPSPPVADASPAPLVAQGSLTPPVEEGSPTPPVAEGAADPVRDAAIMVAATSDRGGRTAAVVIAFGWHAAINLPALLLNWPAYRQPWVAGTGWLVFAGAGIVASAWLLRRIRPLAGPLVGVLLLVDAAVSATVPPDLLFGPANWGWGTIGWFALLVFWDRGVGGLVAVLATGSAIALATVLANGGGNAADLSRYTMYLYGTAVLPIALHYGAGLLSTMARNRAAAVAARTGIEAERLAAGHAHRERQQRLRLIGRTAGAVLAALADGQVDPADPAVQQRCAREASRLRRLIAESDDVPDPLLHELRACVDVAERNGLPIEFVVIGSPPPLPVEIRRRLAEPHTATLATARQWARLTVLAGPEEVVVSVTTPGGAGVSVAAATAGAGDAVEYAYERDEELVWTQTRWRAAPLARHEDASASQSSTIIRWWWRGSAPGSPPNPGWRWWVPARIRRWCCARVTAHRT